MHTCSDIQNYRAEGPLSPLREENARDEGGKGLPKTTEQAREGACSLTTRTVVPTEPWPCTRQAHGIPSSSLTQVTSPKPGGRAALRSQSITKEVCDVGQQVEPTRLYNPSSPNVPKRSGNFSAVFSRALDTAL